MQNHEYIVVHRIDKATPLDEHIPLHMTALHWFEADRGPEYIIRELQAVAESHRPITTTATTEDLFGPEKDIAVMRLERTPELLSLHLVLVEMARRMKFVLDERWVGKEDWNPHVTHQPEKRLFPGDTVHITDLDLITKRPDGMRELVTRVTFGVRP